MKTLKFLASFIAVVLLSFLFTQALAFADDAPPGVDYLFSEDEEDDSEPPTLGGTPADDDEDLGAGAGEDEDEDEEEDDDDDGAGTPPPPPPPPPPDPKVKKDLSKTGPETYVFLLVGLTLSLVVNRKLATKKNRN